MQAREEIAGGFFVAGGDAAELFDKVEEAFDEVAFGVERKVAVARDLAFDFGGMTGLMARTSRLAMKLSAS